MDDRATLYAAWLAGSANQAEHRLKRTTFQDWLASRTPDAAEGKVECDADGCTTPRYGLQSLCQKHWTAVNYRTFEAEPPTSAQSQQEADIELVEWASDEILKHFVADSSDTPVTDSIHVATGIIRRVRTHPTPTESAARRELLCELCGRDYPIWSAESELWNRVMREGDRANADEYAFVCPTCFTMKAALSGVAHAFDLTWSHPPSEGGSAGSPTRECAGCGASIERSSGFVKVGDLDLETTGPQKGIVRELCGKCVFKWEWNEAGELKERETAPTPVVEAKVTPIIEQLCECGHMRKNHDTSPSRRPCFLCECDTFTTQQDAPAQAEPLGWIHLIRPPNKKRRLWVREHKLFKTRKEALDSIEADNVTAEPVGSAHVNLRDTTPELLTPAQDSALREALDDKTHDGPWGELIGLSTSLARGRWNKGRFEEWQLSMRLAIEHCREDLRTALRESRGGEERR